MPDQTWLTSDTHFLHKRIAEYEPTRVDYDDDRLVELWNETVAPTDIVVHLGDVMLGGAPAFAPIAHALHGRKFLVLGNHDTRSRTFYDRYGFSVIDPYSVSRRGWIAKFQHYPESDENEFAVPIDHLRNDRTLVVHGHVHSATLPDRRNLNVSTEVTGFRPVPIIATLDQRIDELE